MSQLQLYEPIKDVDPIISPIVAKFRESNPEFKETKKLRIYNTTENPLFKLHDVEILLGKKNIGKVIRDDQKKPKDEQMYIEGKDYTYGNILSENGYKRKSMFFTRRGFQIYLMTSRGDISNLFRNFLLVVLEELSMNGHVTLQKALKKTEEKYKAEIAKISGRLSHLNIVLEKEQLLRQETEEHLAEVEIVRDDLKIVSEYQKRQLLQAKEYQENMEEDFPNSKEDELRLLKRRYMRPLRVYLVPYEKVQRAMKRPRKKKIKKPKNRIYEYLSKAKVKELGLDDSSSDEEDQLVPMDSFVMEYDYKLYGVLHPPHKDDTYYYTISPSKKLAKSLGIYVGDIYITDADHYDGLKNYLIENCSTPLKGAFITTLGEMEEKLREIFIIQNRSLR